MCVELSLKSPSTPYSWAVSDKFIYFQYYNIQLMLEKLNLGKNDIKLSLRNPDAKKVKGLNGERPIHLAAANLHVSSVQVTH